MNQAANFRSFRRDTITRRSDLVHTFSTEHPALTVDIEHDNEIAIGLKDFPEHAEKLITALSAYPPPPKCECGECERRINMV